MDAKDLLDLVAPVAKRLPQTDEDEPFRFSTSTLLNLPKVLQTDQLIIKRIYHDYGGWRIDYPQVFAQKEIYEALGIVTACVLLQPQHDSVSIYLTNSDSEIRTLRIEFPHPNLDDEYLHGMHQVPVTFVYWPEQVTSKPWLHHDIPDPEAYPRFILTNRDDCQVTDDNWANRDVLYGFGSAEGTARLIQLWLDMSRKASSVPEFLLESEAGFRGVAPASAEIRFWLPGGDASEDMFP